MWLAGELIYHRLHVCAKNTEVVHTIWGPVTVSVATVVVGQGVPSLFCQLLSSATPGVPGLASSMRKNNRGLLRITPYIGGQLHAIRGSETPRGLLKCQHVVQ